MNIKKGDMVKILTGKDSGKTGKVINVDYKTGKASVEGLNVFKKHVRAKRQGEKGEVVQLSRPMNVSNLILVCPSCHKPTRPGYRVEDKIKTRYCKKCQATI
ncbi:MAG: 50S ribosomal protein L24 [Minisyncoccia bacterium]|jgi:large subunit ribosomal protein L24